MAETEILHGCRPVSAFMEITRIEGATVYELDGEPALKVIERMLGLPIGGGAGRNCRSLPPWVRSRATPTRPMTRNPTSTA